MGRSQGFLRPGKPSTRGLLPLPVSPWGLLPEDDVFWVLREPGSSSLDLNLSIPSMKGRGFAARGSGTWRIPDPHPPWSCLFSQILMDLCTDILNSHRCVWLRPRSPLHPVPSAALGDNRVPPGRRPGWGREAKQTRSRSASPRHVRTPDQASWPQGRYCLCWEPETRSHFMH